MPSTPYSEGLLTGGVPGKATFHTRMKFSLRVVSDRLRRRFRLRFGGSSVFDVHFSGVRFR
jgi:hypothetical protein